MGGLGLQWVSGLMLGLDCGGFSGGSFDFVVFLVEGLILSAVVQFTVCWDGFCFAGVKYGGKVEKKKNNCFIIF
jgi:hypothetical protein